MCLVSHEHDFLLGFLLFARAEELNTPSTYLVYFLGPLIMRSAGRRSSSSPFGPFTEISRYYRHIRSNWPNRVTTLSNLLAFEMVEHCLEAILLEHGSLIPPPLYHWNQKKRAGAAYGIIMLLLERGCKQAVNTATHIEEEGEKQTLPRLPSPHHPDRISSFLSLFLYLWIHMFLFPSCIFSSFLIVHISDTDLPKNQTTTDETFPFLFFLTNRLTTIRQPDRIPFYDFFPFFGIF